MSLKKLFIFSLIIFSVGGIGHQIYMGNINLFNITESQSMFGWILRLIRDIGIFSATAIAIIWSVISISISNNKKIPSFFLSLSVLLCMSLSGYTGFMHYQLLKSPLLKTHPVFNDTELKEKYNKFI